MAALRLARQSDTTALSARDKPGQHRLRRRVRRTGTEYCIDRLPKACAAL